MNRRPADSDIFLAISHPVRRAVLDRLSQGEASVRELKKMFPKITAPALSQHLKVLRDIGLVHEQRQGRLRVYRLDPALLLPILEWVSHYEQFWNEKLKSLKGFLKNKRKDR